MVTVLGIYTLEARRTPVSCDGPMVDVEYIGPSQQDLGAAEPPPSPPPTEPVPSASPSVSRWNRLAHLSTAESAPMSAPCGYPGPAPGSPSPLTQPLASVAARAEHTGRAGSGSPPRTSGTGWSAVSSPGRTACAGRYQPWRRQRFQSDPTLREPAAHAPARWVSRVSRSIELLDVVGVVALDTPCTSGSRSPGHRCGGG